MRRFMLPAFNLSRTAVARVELRLRDSEGNPWVLSLSPGMERFVGPYPRLPGMDSGGPLLRFVASG